MSSESNKSFRERGQASRDDVVGFWSSTKGLITAGVLIVGVVVALAWSVIADIIGVFA